MLKIVQITNRAQIAELFRDFNPQEQSWLVSDLRTKLELQEKILERDGQYVDESVLRASDLWKILLKRLEPRLRLVSDPFAKSLLRSLMDEHAEVLGVNSSAEDTVFSYIDQMAPIIFHPEGAAQMATWLEEHPEAARRWKDWYLRARFCAVKLLEEHKIITADWITAYLQGFNNLEQVWNIPLIVDLSGEITRVEAELLRVISRTMDVTIIEPTPAWKSEYSFLLRPYEDLRNQSQDKRVLAPVTLPEKKVQVLRFSGMLAEIKNAVGQLRAWLDSGLEPQNLSVIAPDIETYWPVLEAFLREEGIPVQKDITHKVQSLPSVTRWLAHLRSRSGGLSTSDLEMSFYEKTESEALRYEEFRALFKSLYVNEDLARNQLIHKIYFEQIDTTTKIVRDEFVGRALKMWTSSETEIVQVILRELLQNAVPATVLSWKDWLSYLETIVAAKEFNLERGHTKGVLVTKLMAADSSKSRYRIFVGLTDESLKSKNKTQLMSEDYFGIAKDMGFYLDNPDQSDVEFELRLLAEAPALEDIYCFGVSDLEGSLQSPSTFWMETKARSEGGLEHHEALQVPFETRWDEVQGSSTLQKRTWLEGREEAVLNRIQLDLGRTELPNISVTKKPRLSISSLEKYLECPFIFAAQRYFKLQDFPDIDLDIDHRTRGQIAHALFEKLTVEPMRFNWSIPELESLLEEIKKEKDLLLADERLWMPLRKKHVQIATRFLEFEQKWRKLYGKTRTVGREKKFEFYIHPTTQEISTTPSDESYRVSGQIDRIDSDGANNLVVLDYKSSSGGISAHGSWLKNSNLQLLFYAWVIEKSLMEEVEGEVIGLFYYVFKNFERKGFHLEDRAEVLYPANKRNKNGTPEVKEQYLTEMHTLLMNTVDRIHAGEIKPEPVDTKNCKSCDWRRLCRAPHLN